LPPSLATVWHDRPVVQEVVPAPWQQAAPSEPQATQLPAVQRELAAVHVPPRPPQQASPTPPQAFMPMPHAPFMHMPNP